MESELASRVTKYFTSIVAKVDRGAKILAACETGFLSCCLPLLDRVGARECRRKDCEAGERKEETREMNHCCL